MTEKKREPFRLLMLITAPKLAEKAAALFEHGRVPMQYQFYGRGTASREMMDMLGLDSGEKNVMMSMLPKSFADEMLRKLKKDLRLGTSNTGVACTIPLSGGNSRLIQMVEYACAQRETQGMRRGNMQENEFQMIVAVVNQGFSEDVMAAARPAGAAGGTVFHSRRVGSEESVQLWGISVQQEKEAVMILSRKEEKLAIMQAICEKCGMDSDAQGIVLSIPVDSVVGIE
ncbi:MAG: transposase [Clostridia bacterium]|nr:transposase [Clostridia bacterium]